MDALTVTGQPVDYHFFPGESFEVSHGDFLFWNSSDKQLTVTIQECFFMENNNSINLPSFFVYIDDTETGKTFSVLPHNSVVTHITFQSQIALPGFQKKYGLILRALSNNKSYEATCEINIYVERYPP